MKPARENPWDESSRPKKLGPQLVPPRSDAPVGVPQEEFDIGDHHPATTILIVALIAFTLAFTFYSAIMLWVWFRGTGVDWMFSTH